MKEMKRFISYNFMKRHKSFYCTSSVSKTVVNSKQNNLHLKHFELIQDFTGSPPEAVRRALTKHVDLQLMDEKALLSKIDLLKKMNLSDVRTIKAIPLIRRHPSKLKNRYEILCEYGVMPHKITTVLLNKYFNINKYPVAKLKELGLIEKDADVLQNLWKAAGLQLDHCPKSSDDASLKSLKAIALKAYLKEKMEFSDKAMSKNENDYLFRLQNKSFNTMNRNYDIFTNIVNLSKKRIEKNWFILYSDPDNILEIINRVKKIGNVDVKQCLHVYLKIGLMTASNLEKSMEYMKEAGISESFLHRCLKIYTLNCETVRKRLEEMKKNDFFTYCTKSPRILEIIHYQVKAKKRLKILEQLKLIAFSGYIAKNEKDFNRLCIAGGRPSGIDCLYFLCAELEMNKEELMNKLRRHPRWPFVPLVHVGRNLQNLRKDFTDEEIKKNIYILFYYSEKLQTELETLDSREGLELFKENGTVKKEFVLPLVLYFLERESNFTGESIWDVETNPYQDLPDPTEVLKSCT